MLNARLPMMSPKDPLICPKGSPTPKQSQRPPLISPKDRILNLTLIVQPSCNLCACPSADGQAAQLLAGMLAGALTHRQNMRVTPRERDLTHLVDLIQSQLCKGQPDKALQLLGMMQYVHVSDTADDWLEVVMIDGHDHDIFGEAPDLLATLSKPQSAPPPAHPPTSNGPPNFLPFQFIASPAFIIQAPSPPPPPPPRSNTPHIQFLHPIPSPFPFSAIAPPPKSGAPPPSSALFPLRPASDALLCNPCLRTNPSPLGPSMSCAL